MNTQRVEIDLEQFSKQELIDIISLAHQKNMTINELIVFCLEKMLVDSKIE